MSFDCWSADSLPVCTFTNPGTAWMIRCFSSTGDSPWSAVATITEVLPTRLYQRCASLKVVLTRVAPPSDAESAKSKVPTSVTGFTPWSVVRPSRWPTCRCWLLATEVSTAIWPWPCGKWPAVRVFVLYGLGSVERTSVGAPLVVTTLPLTTIAPSAWIWPSALATPGTARTLPISDAGSGPVSPPPPWSGVNACLCDRITSVPLSADWKIDEKAFVIWSVSTNVPDIMATPRTIAIDVRAARSLCPSRLFRASRRISPSAPPWSP